MNYEVESSTEREYSVEEALWCAVMEQAFKDLHEIEKFSKLDSYNEYKKAVATKGMAVYGKRNNFRANAYMKHRALFAELQSFFRPENDGFKACCFGIRNTDPSVFIFKAKEIIDVIESRNVF